MSPGGTLPRWEQPCPGIGPWSRGLPGRVPWRWRGRRAPHSSLRPADASGESGLTQLLMSEVMKLQKKVQDLTALLSSKDDLIKELRVKDSLLRKHQERVQRLKEECEACGRELKRCKDENYDLAMRLARQSEEKGAALMRNRDLQLEVRPRPRPGPRRRRRTGPGLTGSPCRWTGSSTA